jgi:hypothetical protein
MLPSLWRYWRTLCDLTDEHSGHMPRDAGDLVTAQESFATLMRQHVAPAMRDLGLKGSGGVFTLPDAEHWASIGFQRSTYSDRHEIRFTVNLTAGSKAVWQEARAARTYLPERPAPNTFYGSFIWQSRIGQLLPGGQDKWWSVGPQTALEALALDVAAAIRDYGIPALRNHLSRG